VPIAAPLRGSIGTGRPAAVTVQVRPPRRYLQETSHRHVSQSSRTVKSPATAGLGGPAVGAAKTRPDPRSPSPETLPGHKSNRPNSHFYLIADTSPSNSTTYNSKRVGVLPVPRHTPTASERWIDPARPSTVREAAGEPARPAAQRPLGASSPERAPSANRRAHRLDQPEAGACPPTRKADRDGRPEGGRTRRRSR
jgi:hypothetical protein